MQKKFVSALLAVTLLFTASAHTEDLDDEGTSVTKTTDEGTPVGQASDEGARHATRKIWQNVALATVVIGGAITALVLVSQNHGRHHHSKEK